MEKIDDYKDNDEKYILKLFKTVFGKPMGLGYWKWRFASNPLNKLMIKLIWEKGQLVSHYAVCPAEFIIENNVVLGSLSMTTMTHPDFMGKGYFTLSAQKLYRDFFKSDDLKLVYGFPNMNSHYGFNRNLSWKDIARVPTLSKKVDKIGLSTSEVKEIHKFTSNHYKKFKSATSEYAIKLNRSETYLNWRYFENPVQHYRAFEIEETHSFLVCKKFQTNPAEIDIVELVCEPDLEIIKSLIDAMLSEMKHDKPRVINIWLPKQDPNHVLLEKLGFAFNLPVTWLGGRAIDSKYGSYINEKGFYYSMGDSDIF